LLDYPIRHTRAPEFCTFLFSVQSVLLRTYWSEINFHWKVLNLLSSVLRTFILFWNIFVLGGIFKNGFAKHYSKRWKTASPLFHSESNFRDLPHRIGFQLWKQRFQLREQRFNFAVSRFWFKTENWDAAKANPQDNQIDA